MVKCDKCGVETYMPFKCNYCGGYFCEQHRLPELHDCKGKYDQTKPSTVQVGEYSSSGGFYGNYSTSRIIRPFWFSRKELRDLAIGLLVIVTLPFVKVWSYFYIQPLFVIVIVTILALAFVLHELAHKFAAQRLGMWAEFRLSTTGLLFTFLSFILMQGGLPLMIVAPGAVMIKGLLNWNDYGKISIAGPATNIAQALIYLFAHALVLPESVLGVLSIYGIEINAFLALFNLIPFGVFDGMKIYKWDKRVWAAAAITAGLLVLFAMMI